jgi:hypothetical protein
MNVKIGTKVSQFLVWENMDFRCSVGTICYNQIRATYLCTKVEKYHYIFGMKTAGNSYNYL